MRYDIAIIGGGAAGCSAAIELKTSGKNFIWFSRRGGDGRSAGIVRNYPGLPDVSENALLWAFRNHCERLGVDSKQSVVREVRDAGRNFILITEDGSYEAVCVILCLGAPPFPVAPEKLVRGLQVCGKAVAVGRDGATDVAGIFAAGDCTGPPYGYVKAAGEGFVAARSAAEYVQKMKKHPAEN